MTALHALILGIVEGLTEFLPVSSTAHLEITARLLGIAQTNFVKTFEISIQLGAILAVVVLYAKLLIRNRAVWKRILAAFLPTAVIGFVLYRFIKDHLIGNDAIVAWSIGIGGIILIILEYVLHNKESIQTTEQELSTLPYSKALFIGLVQALAVVPGVSRSAATIVAGRAVGISRRAIVEFSFLLAIPTMVAATGYDLLRSASAFSASDTAVVLIGFVAAFFTALLAVKLFLDFVKNRSLAVFGFYRIALAIIIVFCIV